MFTSALFTVDVAYVILLYTDLQFVNSSETLATMKVSALTFLSLFAFKCNVLE